MYRLLLNLFLTKCFHIPKYSGKEPYLLFHMILHTTDIQIKLFLLLSFVGISYIPASLLHLIYTIYLFAGGATGAGAAVTSGLNGPFVPYHRPRTHKFQYANGNNCSFNQ
jgi:hypothetical protein